MVKPHQSRALRLLSNANCVIKEGYVAEMMQVDGKDQEKRMIPSIPLKRAKGRMDVC